MSETSSGKGLSVRNPPRENSAQGPRKPWQASALLLDQSEPAVAEIRKVVLYLFKLSPLDRLPAGSIYWTTLL